MNKKAASLAILALLCITTLLVFSQTSSQFPELDKNGKPLLPRPMPHLVYSPTDLAHSGVALPASVGGATPKHQHHSRGRRYQNDRIRLLHPEL